MRSALNHVNGIDLHYLDNESDGPVLVMSHGLTANAHFFDGLGKELAGGVRLIAVDLRGRGLSGKPDSGYAMEDHAADVLGLLDELELERANIGGHSFGGLLTYHIASHHPERVERCVVMDAPAEVDETILEQIQPSLDRLGRRVESWEVFIEAVRAQPYFENWWDPQIETYYRADVKTNEDGSVQPRSSPEHIGEAVEGTLGIPWTEYLEEIAAPILLIRAVDPFGPPGSPPILGVDQADRMLRRMRDGRLVELEGNHYSFLYGESVKTMAAEISKFLGVGT